MNCSIESAFWMRFSFESLSINSDNTCSPVWWSRSWESLMNWEVWVLEVVIIVVNTVLGHLNDHVVTLGPASWSWAADSSRVNELNWLLLWRELKMGWSKSTLVVQWIGVVSEFITREVNLIATVNWSHIWEKTGHSWLFKVCKSEVSVRPVDTVQGYLEVKMGVGSWTRWSLANKSNRGIEVCTHDLVSELAVGNNSVLWLVIKPCSKNFNQSSTLGEASTWEDLEYVRNFVRVEFNTWWLISVEGPWLLTGVSFELFVETGLEISDSH